MKRITGFVYISTAAYNRLKAIGITPECEESHGNDPGNYFNSFSVPMADWKKMSLVHEEGTPECAGYVFCKGDKPSWI